MQEPYGGRQEFQIRKNHKPPTGGTTQTSTDRLTDDFYDFYLGFTGKPGYRLYFYRLCPCCP
ncbi:hypothetical protein FACS1894163_01600 [Spirochaetia bacterium]|nr:hypothetical protein FACS1894163_01600 [Spirochaetia bacterium]